MKRTVGKGRMTQAQVVAIVNEIESYRQGQRPGRLTWGKIVEFSGFSHVSLWKRTEIHAAFQQAKAALRDDATPPIKAPRTSDERVAALQLKIEELTAIIQAYDEMWVRYEFNVHRVGLNPEELRRPIPGLARSAVRSRRHIRPVR
jgi:hypothetical protein